MTFLAASKVKSTLKAIFQCPSGGWRSDGHVLLTILRRHLHEYAGRLRHPSPEVRAAAAVHCSAIVKIDLAMAEMTGHNSSDHLLDAVRLLGLAASAGNSVSVSVAEKEFTKEESKAGKEILTQLESESRKRKPARSNQFPPIVTSLAQPLRYAHGIRKANACGPTSANFVDTDRTLIMDAFVEAHSDRS